MNNVKRGLLIISLVEGHARQTLTLRSSYISVLPLLRPFISVLGITAVWAHMKRRALKLVRRQRSSATDMSSSHKGKEWERAPSAVLFYNDESEAELSFRAAIKSGGRKALLADGAVASTLARSLQKFMMAR